MNNPERMAKLLLLIIREGKFRHSGQNFTARRHQSLEGLECFYPEQAADGGVSGKLKKWIFGPDPASPAHPALAAWMGQAAFIISRFKKTGQHLCVPSLKLCVIRNPKAASTSIAAALLERRFPELTRYALTPEQINFLADANLYDTLQACQRDYQFIMIVRNPFARLVALYRAFFENNNFIYQDYLFGILKKEMTFHDFVQTIDLVPDTLKDQHFKPQTSVLAYYEKKGVNVRILKLEETEMLQNFLADLSLHLGVLNRNEKAVDHTGYYTEATAKTAYRLYKSDVLRFGYEAEWGALCDQIQQHAPPLVR